MINHLAASVPRTVTVRGNCLLNTGIADVVDIVLKYDKRVMGFVYASWFEPRKTRETVVVGEERTAIFDDLSDRKLRLYDNTDVTKPCESLRIEKQSPLQNQCIHFLESVITREKPVTDSYQGHVVVRILECAQESLETGKEIEIDYAS